MRLDAPLDDALRSASHVRVLRALHGLDGVGASAREIARRAGIAHPTGSRVLRGFAEQGIVDVERLPSTDVYRLRPAHALVEQTAHLFQWESRLRENLVEFLRRRLAGSESITAAWLFGSAASGPMTSDSDIDLAVICAPAETATVEQEMAELSAAVHERFGIRPTVVVATKPLTRLTSRATPGHRLWTQIDERGIPLLPERAVAG